MEKNDREELIDILEDLDVTCDVPIKVDEDGCGTYTIKGAEYVADHLIANGVTVQEWISVKERLPTIYDADADNCVLAIHKASNKRYYHWRSVAENPFDFTHWMKTPQPPKGE